MKRWGWQGYVFDIAAGRNEEYFLELLTYPFIEVIFRMIKISDWNETQIIEHERRLREMEEEHRTKKK